MRTLRNLALTVLLGAICTSPLMAQRPSSTDDNRILGSSALDAAVAGHESAADRQRAQLDEFLSRADVRDLARDRGIDLERVTSAAAGLSDGEMAQIAPFVAKASAAVQRGGTITISVATVIIILLLLILIT